MSLDKDAIRELQREALQANIHGAMAAGVRELAIPKDWSLQNLDHLFNGPLHFKYTFSTHLPADFCRYIAAMGGMGSGHLVIDVDDMESRLVFDQGTPDQPGHGLHKAELRLRPTAAYHAMPAHPTSFTQRELADWLEDWAPHLTAYDSDGEELPIRQVVAAVRSIDIEAMSKQSSHVQDLGEQQTLMTSVEAKSKHVLPSGLKMTLVPYYGLPESDVYLRLGLRTGTSTPTLTLAPCQLEALRESWGQQLHTVLVDHLNTELPDATGALQVFIGSL
jgi:uncharacterized protein YfdQ (DUF2303 family)